MCFDILFKIIIRPLILFEQKPFQENEIKRGQIKKNTIPCAKMSEISVENVVTDEIGWNIPKEMAVWCGYFNIV